MVVSIDVKGVMAHVGFYCLLPIYYIYFLNFFSELKVVCKTLQSFLYFNNALRLIGLKKCDMPEVSFMTEMGL